MRSFVLDVEESVIHVFKQCVWAQEIWYNSSLWPIIQSFNDCTSQGKSEDLRDFFVCYFGACGHLATSRRINSALKNLQCVLHELVDCWVSSSASVSSLLVMMTPIHLDFPLESS